ncbi:phosphoribosylglycinamide formyltransferase [Sulfurimonas sp. MAG313]|nr:phosphoribosylglycinamide formyltransferase [Sulfurimonas sp. MAG313]MDF1881502.1 phosphoribosylglycinamide formyltransferase [Sulfurimonas sp. MAG313]
MKRIVILFSGEGSNMLRIIQKLEHYENIEVAATITNKQEAKGIEKIKAYNIPLNIINHKDYASREEFDQDLVNKISSYKPDLVVLAGFMRILTPVFTKNIKSINLHPSILPHFKGAKAIEQSYADIEKPAGISVHWVSEELDSGLVIAQKELTRIKDEPFESFKNRIHLLEYELLPETVVRLLQ